VSELEQNDEIEFFTLRKFFFREKFHQKKKAKKRSYFLIEKVSLIQFHHLRQRFNFTNPFSCYSVSQTEIDLTLLSQIWTTLT